MIYHDVYRDGFDHEHEAEARNMAYTLRFNGISAQ